MSKDNPLIAIVDDDASVCRAIQRLLRSVAMNTETFTSGREFIDCIEMVPSFHADCVVLDVQMPDMSGLEVQEWLVRSGNLVPVIFITAHDEPGARAHALGMGAVAFLRKPFHAELLIETLRAALNSDAASGKSS